MKKPLVFGNNLVNDLTKNPVLHERGKHIKARFRFLREKINHSELEVRHCSSEA